MSDLQISYLISCSSLAVAVPLWAHFHHRRAAQKGKKEAPCSLLSLCLVPGYSKLQIAADNIDRYWSMFDLLTHTLSSSSSSSYLWNRGRRIEDQQRPNYRQQTSNQSESLNIVFSLFWKLHTWISVWFSTTTPLLLCTINIYFHGSVVVFLSKYGWMDKGMWLMMVSFSPR